MTEFTNEPRNVSGNIQTTYTYGPFGQTAAAGASNDNPYQFHGREAEPMTGLLAGMYYFRARYLNTGLSRFVSRDSAGFQGGGHLYNYAAMRRRCSPIRRGWRSRRFRVRGI